jgi:ubiquinone/menaquinone biosynthesis C-methylase UbiE
MTYYDEISESYDDLHKAEQLRKIAIIKSELGVRKEDSLLDVGTGTGFSLEHFDCNKIGIDPSKKLLEKARHNVLQDKAEDLPFKDDSFDFVISVTAIHNFDDIEKGIKEMKRVGRKDFAFSILKKSKGFDLIEKIIKKEFTIKKTVDEGIDMIFFLEK